MEIECIRKATQRQRNVVSLKRLVCMALLLLAFEHAPAQTSDQQDPYRLKVKARRVVLDVVVKDANGKIVDSLATEDFSVYQGKVQQRISNIELPSQHASPSEENTAVKSVGNVAPSSPGPTVILVLDEMNTAFEDMAYSHQQVDRYLSNQPQTLRLPTMLLIVTNTSLETIHGYTRAREELRSSLKRWQAEYPYRMMRSGSNSAGSFERMAASLKSLHQVAESTRGTEGRKAIVWLGKGFPRVNLRVLDSSESKLLQDAMQRLTTELPDARMKR